MFLARKFHKKENEPPIRLLDDLFRKTKTVPCVYWLPLTSEQVSACFSGNCNYFRFTIRCGKVKLFFGYCDRCVDVVCNTQRKDCMCRITVIWNSTQAIAYEVCTNLRVRTHLVWGCP